MSSILSLTSPLSGPLLPLEDVPDPVFAQKMVGDGISIDPVSQSLLAPCDGEVVQLHRACHAITIEADSGLQILMHIGIDTVALEGVGFSAKVAVGERVQRGQVLIDFDADFVATKAKSLLTQIIIINGDKVQAMEHASGFVTAGEGTILTITLATLAAEAEEEPGNVVTSEDILVPNPTGLHARPAALLVAEAKKFSSLVHLYKGGDQANAKSLISIMGLEVNCGDRVNIVATGADAQAAVDALTPLMRSGLGERCPAFSPPMAQTAETTVKAEDDAAPLSNDPAIILGVSASPGLAIGKVFQLKREDIHVQELAKNARVERNQFDRALKQAHEQLSELQLRVEDDDEAAIFAAHQELLVDPELIENAKSLIADGKSAAFAWKSSYSAQASVLAKLKNTLLAARANDLRDVGRRVLQLILGLETHEQEMPEKTILIAEDLTPSDTANLDTSKVLGFCTMTGGASSHVAILARSMGLPAIAGIESRARNIPNGTPVILDAVSAQLTINPSEREIEEIQQAQQALALRHASDLANAHLPATTTDGHSVEVVANIASASDATEGRKMGGEGVGLLRSEFLFMNRPYAPSEDEQVASYVEVAKQLEPSQPLVIRTLDVGGDKPLPYLPIDPEENPFLGLRGIRVSLHKTQLFRSQLRAILRAAEFGNIHIMFPMITTIEDLRSAKQMLEEERVKLGVAAIPVGIMVEVPATAIMAEQFAKEVDFFSIGTNDLTQYTLAIDRGHPLLAAQADGLNPGVLQLIASTVRGAHKYDKWVGVCGGIASDPMAVPILVGLGVDELSASVPSIPAIKAQVRSLTLSQCQDLAQQALQQNSAIAVRDLIKTSRGVGVVNENL